MSPIEKLIGEPDDDPTDLSNAPFAFGRFPTGSESSAEYTLSSAPSQSQPPRKQARLARPIPFATCGAELAVHERPQQMLYDYQPPSQQPDRYTPRHVPPVLEYLQGIQHGTRDHPRATTGEDFIPTPSRRSSPVNELTPASLDELESIDALAAARAVILGLRFQDPIVLANKKWKREARMKGNQDGLEAIWSVICTGLGLVWYSWPVN
ncbi:hypothetical protein LMH87_000327 [Akanthomyces muscarius]|uniref:Uncharacterized protein n=1 Tax=Akanthomyces muscarius TaxID=2231603 RepID=A0A9W8UNP9_AKAMU|nr:hypothetical protein LMH87_000327 [Akanthomyces muscarius]KAJ4155061.1 hypothetical protein LMH87_000327 [Akanthomyces muscarius]